MMFTSEISIGLVSAEPEIVILVVGPFAKSVVESASVTAAQTKPRTALIIVPPARPQITPMQGKACSSVQSRYTFSDTHNLGTVARRLIRHRRNISTVR